jgi:hypothetical protein
MGIYIHVYSIQPLSALHARRFGCGEKADGGGGMYLGEGGLWLLGNFVHSTCIDELGAAWSGVG